MSVCLFLSRPLPCLPPSSLLSLLSKIHFFKQASLASALTELHSGAMKAAAKTPIETPSFKPNEPEQATEYFRGHGENTLYEHTQVSDSSLNYVCDRPKPAKLKLCLLIKSQTNP